MSSACDLLTSPAYRRHSAAGSCGAAQWQFRDPRRHPNRYPPRSSCRAGRALFRGTACRRRAASDCRCRQRRRSVAGAVREPSVDMASRSEPCADPRRWRASAPRPTARLTTRLRAALRLDANPEGYTLDVSPSRVVLSASDPRGLVLRRRHAWQLSTAGPPSDTISVPAVHIVDSPRFAWRGLMLDSARHYQSPEFILQFIDWMALHKLNVSALAPDGRPGVAPRDQEISAPDQRRRLARAGGSGSCG